MFELTPKFDSRESFYRKAMVKYTGPWQELHSYGTHVMSIEPEQRTVVLLPRWNESATTLRHVKEFLKQHGFTAESKAQPKRITPPFSPNFF